MSFIRNFTGPKSKYNRSLPYTYGARIDMLYWNGVEPIYSYYYSETICGQTEYLDTNNYYIIR